MDLSTRCAVCERVSASVEVDALADGQWRLRFVGIEAGNGSGDVIATERARALIEVLTPPIDVDRLDDLGFYDDAGICRDCQVPYCAEHWSVSVSGYGRCANGHGKTLDPHWSPDY